MRGDRLTDPTDRPTDAHLQGAGSLKMLPLTVRGAWKRSGPMAFPMLTAASALSSHHLHCRGDDKGVG